jgi:uncharacterized protein
MATTLNAQPGPGAPSPVVDKQRLRLIDSLRGAALLGILLMNIQGFGMPVYFAESVKGDPSSIDFWVYMLIAVLFEGKMRALFGMVFGAGVLLFIINKQQAGSGTASLFYRRMSWLVVFGFIHAHVILWFGDILYLYGLCGMIIYLFRKAKPVYLALGVPLVAVVSFAAVTWQHQQWRATRIAYVEAMSAADRNEPLTEAQNQALADWRAIEKTILPSRDDVEEITRKFKSDYSTVASVVRPVAWTIQTTLLPMLIWDSLALMVLGMALYQWGFLSGRWSQRSYVIVMAIGYGIGLPLVIYSVYHDYLHYPNLEAMLERLEMVSIEWVRLNYPFQRIFLTLAHVSAFILCYRLQVARTLFHCLESVGQMAFTNYIMHSLICTFFFFGYGLNFYGELSFHQMYFVVLVIWIIQLTVSPIWLRFFYFGPLEWMWRSLTYWKRQPFRRIAELEHQAQS